MIKIKDCPCCGGKVKVKRYGRYEAPFFYFSNKYAVLCRYSEGEEGCGLESGHFKIKEEAIEMWNKRR